MKLFNLKNLLILSLLIIPACASNKDYIYYKSKCACENLKNYADIKSV